MFNPLVGSFEDLSDAEVDEKMHELSRKYFLTKNPQVQQQIQTIIEMLREETKKRNAKNLSSQNPESDLDNLINVS